MAEENEESKESEEREEDGNNDWVDLTDDIENLRNLHKYSPEKNGVKRVTPPLQQISSQLPKVLVSFGRRIATAESVDAFKDKIDKATAIKDKKADCMIIRQLLQIMTNVYKKKPSLSHSETTYYVKLIFPLLYAVLDDLESHLLSPVFVPGEEELLSMTKQLESMGVKVDHRKIYKADGVARLVDDVEILLVETAGPFQTDNPTKMAFDNSKGMFGLLSMSKTIADKYRFSSKEKFKQWKLLFLQPSDCTLRLWTMKYDKNGFYRFERVAKAFISEEFEQKDKCLINLAFFAIELKKHLADALETVKLIKDDHEKQRLEFDSDVDSQRLCLSDIICPKIFKISYNNHSKGFCNQELESPEYDY